MPKPSSGFAAQRGAAPAGASSPQAGQRQGGQYAAQAHQNFVENIKLLTQHPDEVKPEFIAFLQMIGGGAQQQGQQPTPPTRTPSAPAPTPGPAPAAQAAPMSAAR